MHARTLTGLLLGGVTTACTLVSGVDDMAIRKNIPASQVTGDAASPFEADPLMPGADAGKDARPVDAGDFVANGAVTCGATGSWTSCDTSASPATCAEQCAQRGRTCVEDCCAYDGNSTTDYRAKAGMVYAVLTECSYSSMASGNSFGTCSTPPILVGASPLVSVRCCCR